MSKLARTLRSALTRHAAAALVTVGALTAAPAFAGAWSESGDAGDTQATAQWTAGNALSLSSIGGALSSLTDVDLYVIRVLNPALFSATTVGGSIMDTQLFLFTLSGAPVYMNDDADGSTFQSSLPAGDAFGPASAGLYLLGVSLSGNDPVNAVNDFLFAGGLLTDVRGPATSIQPAVLAGFTGGTWADEQGEYSIQLSGAAGAAAAVPEPATGLLAALAVGLCVLPSSRKSRRKEASASAQ